MTLLYLAAICLTLIIIGAQVAGAKKHAASKRAEVDLKQVEAAFPAPLKQELPPPPPLTPQQHALAAQQQALNSILRRRADLEKQINDLRTNATALRVEYGKDISKQRRDDALKALVDARKEQSELVIEQEKLLTSMREEKAIEDILDTATEPVRVDTGGPVAERVADPDLLHDAELHDEEASRASAA